VDSEVAFDTLKGEFYDAAGRAMMVNLRRGEAAEISPDQNGLFLTEEADNLAMGVRGGNRDRGRHHGGMVAALDRAS
jgi:hypothetical protein